MRIALAALATLMVASAPALADQAEGKIKSVDPEKLTITLDNGKTYKLPSEVDLTGIEPGIEIVIAFEEVDGVRQITDMATYE